MLKMSKNECLGGYRTLFTVCFIQCWQRFKASRTEDDASDGRRQSKLLLKVLRTESHEAVMQNGVHSAVQHGEYVRTICNERLDRLDDRGQTARQRVVIVDFVVGVDGWSFFVADVVWSHVLRIWALLVVVFNIVLLACVWISTIAIMNEMND